MATLSLFEIMLGINIGVGTGVLCLTILLRSQGSLYLIKFYGIILEYCNLNLLHCKKLTIYTVKNLLSVDLVDFFL